MRKETAKYPHTVNLTPRNGTRQEGSTTKLKARADKKRQPITE